MDTPSHDTSRLHGLFTALREDLSTQIVGQSALVERLLIALLADGHLLVEGAPGLAKTTAIRALASRVDADRKDKLLNSRPPLAKRRASYACTTKKGESR